ncbi:MAG TPA: TetR/AcrR family transcriptional regulator, partial [Alphaproteobacteria bacterium]
MSSRRPQTSERTVSRILEVAEEQFRRVGYAKTAVADIARALGMSPANIYRFFASKSAINEAICEKHFAEVHGLLRAIMAEDRPASERLERFVIELHRYNKTRCVSERRLHDMVAAGMEENWAAVERHIAALHEMIAELIADGVRRGEFGAEVAPTDASDAVCTACTGVLHPTLIAQFAHKDLEQDARRVVRYLLRAMAPAALQETPASAGPQGTP